ncbi:hypothetical protein DMB68_17610 [Flavobacterium hydrophilum]|uniref:Uncharacterized protein n=1 Tax=Flavobacterium hydrophilum TaxID=2211445 RepID=A0A2V4C2C5_9FLAO|nr:hypothetical protein DMB68_17610 [Flavobacterium hydrophilum]
MKVKTLLKTSVFILSLTMGTFVFLFFTQPKTNVVKAEFYEYKNELYPQDCYINLQSKKYLIREVYKYKNGILNEYWFFRQ